MKKRMTNSTKWPLVFCLCIFAMSIVNAKVWTPTGPVQFNSLKDSIADGDTISLLSPSDLAADSTYTMSATFGIDGKDITMQPANIANGRPYINGANNLFQVKNCSFIADNIEYYGGKYFLQLTGACDTILITNSIFDKVARGVIVGGGNPVQYAVVDHCVITNSGGGDNNPLLGSSSTSGYFKYFKLSNSTLANIQAPIIRITTKSTDSMDIIIDHCTMDSIYAGGPSPFYFSKNYDSIVGNSITISNSVISNVTGCTSLWDRAALDTSSATIVETTNVWRVAPASDSITSSAVTLASSYKNFDPMYTDYSDNIATRNFEINNTELLALATDGGVIGDPRWVAAGTGLISQWKLDETSGSVVTDAITGATGEIIGTGHEWVTGVDGNAIDLTNADDTTRIVISDQPSLKAANFTDGSLSLSVLIKFDPAAHGSQVQQEIFMKGSNDHVDGGAGANGTRYELYAKNGGIFFAIDDDLPDPNGKTQLTMDQTNFVANKWAHIVGVRNTDVDSLYIYCNGEPAGVIYDKSLAIDVDTIPMIIGNYWNNSAKVHGKIDDVLIYKGALSASEVKTLYDSYTFPLSDIATLSGLTYGGNLVPGFVSSTLTYDIELAAGTTTVPVVTATATDASASAPVVTPAASLPGATTVSVTAEDGTTTLVYTINFTVAASISTDATLSDLKVNGTTVDGFAAATITYDVELEAGTTTVPTVTATANDANAAAPVVTPAGSLPGSTTVTVTAEDGTTTKTYTINFTIALGIDQLNTFGLNIYPNPAKNSLIVEHVDKLSLAYIYDSNGRLIKTIRKINANTVNIDISDINSGLYLIHVVTVNNSVVNSTFIKK